MNLAWPAYISRFNNSTRRGLPWWDLIYNLKRAIQSQVAVGAGKGGEINEAVLGEAEPWEGWETRLCLWSLGIGITALVVLGFLVNRFLLP